jgi:hypothetical protein
MTEWMLSFPCSRCAFMGIQELGTVHVAGKDGHEELEIVAFCYDCARIMLERRKLPRVKDRKIDASRAEKRIIAFPKVEQPPSQMFEDCKQAVCELRRSIGGFQSAVAWARYAVFASEDLRRKISMVEERLWHGERNRISVRHR